MELNEVWSFTIGLTESTVTVVVEMVPLADADAVLSFRMRNSLIRCMENALLFVGNLLPKSPVTTRRRSRRLPSPLAGSFLI
jgi:hypothetical protein